MWDNYKKVWCNYAQKIGQLLNEPVAVAARVAALAPSLRQGSDIGLAHSHRLRRSAIIETVGLLFVLTAIDLVFGNGDRFATTSPHPFWLVVLLISAQYGPREGLTAALLSSTFLLLGNMPERSLSETMYDYVWIVSQQPFFWIVTALVLGGIRARQIEERDVLIEQVRLVNETSVAIIENY